MFFFFFFPIDYCSPQGRPEGKPEGRPNILMFTLAFGKNHHTARSLIGFIETIDTIEDRVVPHKPYKE